MRDFSDLIYSRKAFFLDSLLENKHGEKQNENWIKNMQVQMGFLLDTVEHMQCWL